VTDEALTPRQVAEELGVTVRTVQRWIADGRLPADRVGGRMRVSRSSLSAVVAEASPGTAPRPAIARLLIANRGEIATRVARTARSLGIATVGVHAPDDRPADGLDETHLVDSYLDAEAMLAIARRAGVDAIHPGYGFLAEDPTFARAVVEAGLVWVGPPAEAIAVVGDKGAARRAAAARGVQVLAGYDGPAQDDATLVAAAAAIGYPLLVKPSAGGGGKGMRAVHDPAELVEALGAARRESAGAFGNDRLILERLLGGARHVEVQVLFDTHGRGIHLGERDCSAQRRNQKIVEEAPAPSLSAELRERMATAALTVAAAVGYVGAGTVEFLVADDDAFYFLEMNARLQVEHPVTEAVTGRDLVADQLRIAGGEPIQIAGDSVRGGGHAIEARLYAEDPAHGFLPATGRVVRLRWPAGVRVDTGIREGDFVSDRYDPMLAKLIAHGPTRREALARLREALDETLVLGVRTNLRFLRWLLDQSVMREAQVRTDTIAGLQLPEPPRPGDEHWQAAATALLMEGPSGAWGGGWRAGAPPAVRMRHADEECRVELGGGEADAVVDGGIAYVDVQGQSLEFALASPPTVDEAVRHAVAHAGGGATLTSPMPGRVIAIRVAAGASVQAHAPVIVIEAMKMEHAVVTPLAGTVTRIAVKEGQQVGRGELLAEVAALESQP
jgi:acetyl-CoA/propionyl-CoA carboxylase biotin carboxyl carrier protein